MTDNRKEICREYEILSHNNPGLLEKLKGGVKEGEIICFCSPKRDHKTIPLKMENEE